MVQAVQHSQDTTDTASDLSVWKWVITGRELLEYEERLRSASSGYSYTGKYRFGKRLRDIVHHLGEVFSTEKVTGVPLILLRLWRIGIRKSSVSLDRIYQQAEDHGLLHCPQEVPFSLRFKERQDGERHHLGTYIWVATKFFRANGAEHLLFLGKQSEFRTLHAMERGRIEKKVSFNPYTRFVFQLPPEYI